MLDLNVTPAVLADADVVAQLAVDFKAADAAPHTERELSTLRALIDLPEAGRVYTIRHAGAIIGYAVLCWGYSVEYGGRDAILDEFYIVPAHRGLGLGIVVLERLAVEARRAGARAVHLEVRPDEIRATNHYDRAGFSDRGSVFMTKRLT
jgi:GNAT superfamily N-acetyltransferase